MNANELSLQLGFYAETYDGDFGECLKKSTAMLRQLQDENEELKHKNEVLKKQNSYLADFEQKVSQSGNFDKKVGKCNEKFPNGQFCKEKLELTDADIEIFKAAAPYYGIECQSFTGLSEFIKQILRKAQEK